MTNETFGQVLKELRERKGISQTKLAKLAKYHHSFISRLEDESRLPHRDSIDKISIALETTQTDRNRLLIASGHLPEVNPQFLTLAQLTGNADGLAYANILHSVAVLIDYARSHPHEEPESPLGWYQ